MEPYDIAILGTGPGGYVAALKAGQMGARVAVVEKSHLGGTCLNNGCIPSKALLASAELLHEIAHAKDFGVKVGEASPDWPAIQKRKDKIIKTLRGGIGNLFKGRSVDVYQGVGRLDGPGKLAVTDGKGKTQTLPARNIIVASGSTPARIPGWPDDAEIVCTSDEALHWKTLPEKLLIVGGGVIGCEFACMMKPLGVDVTVVEMLPSLLPEMDEQLGSELGKIFKRRKIACHTDTKVEELVVDGNGAKATLSGGKALQVDRVLIATGRRPATADIGLESAGLETDRGFVRVDDRMRTGADGVYCIGDANGRCLLAHAASAQGVVAVDSALGHHKPMTAPVPLAVYTFPEIAGVGLTTRQARRQELPVSIGNFPIGYLGKAMAAGDTSGFVKVIRHRETDEILGVHMLGHNVTEVIASAVGLVGTDATVTDLAEEVFAHPTISEAVKEAAEDALGQALHLPPRKVVTVSVGG